MFVIDDIKSINAFGTLNRRQMGSRQLASFISFILLLFTLTAAGDQSLKRLDQPSLENLIDLANINKDMAELLWINCGLELMYANEPIENVELNTLGENSVGSNDIILNSRLLREENLQTIGSVLDPVADQILSECLRKRKRKLLVSGEERSSKFWFTKYLVSWFATPAAPQQREFIQSFAEVPAPSPAVASDIPSQAPITQHPAGHSPLPFFPPVINDSSPPPTDGAFSNSASDSTTNKQRASHKTVIVAVVLTASITFVLVALLFLFYHRACGVGSRIGQNDEKPLLSLSLSDYSIGSSQKSFALGTSNDKEKIDNLSHYPNSKNNMMASSSDQFSNSDNVNASKVETSLGCLSGSAIYSSGDSAKTSHSTVEPPLPPPGMLGSSGKPPLKPPPGRVHLTETPPKKASPPPPVHGPRPLPSGEPLPPPIPSGIIGPHPPPPSSIVPRPPPPPGIGPRPPPSTSIGPPRPPPFALKAAQPSMVGPNHPSTSGSSQGEADALKPKLKPFFWDKVLANPSHSMVWHQIKSGSFQFNEEMIETLFGYTPAEKSKTETRKESSSQDPSTQYIQIIDSKKAQNLLILLKALNVTSDEVCDALQEGNELPQEFLQTLLKMAPTAEEEQKLRHYSGDLSQLGPAEQFLKVLVEIPFAFKRIESLLFMCTLEEETSMVKVSFLTLEAACTELRHSRLFLKLLEAVLKTGNRMNDGTFRGGAQAFKLGTLLKLSDVKGADGKTTLLHFVVQEIIRSEGVRAARTAKVCPGMLSRKSDDLSEDSFHESEDDCCNMGLQVVSGLGGELENVKKAAVLDADNVSGMVGKLNNALTKVQDFLNSDMMSISEENGFHQTLRIFVQNAEVDIRWLLEEEKRIMALVKSTADYFHGKSGKDEGLRLFVIVRDFLIILDKVCKEVKNGFRKSNRQGKEDSVVAPQLPPPDPTQRLFAAIADRRIDDSSSDDEIP